MKKWNWYLVGAIFLFVWGVLNTAMTCTRFGVQEGYYLWFCNVALFGTAFGLWRRNRSWLIAFLAPALFTQTLVVVDNIWRVLFRENLLGLVEFMYQPGTSIDQFLVSHYHLFVIPIALFALCGLEKKRDYSIYLILLFSGLLFPLSYFLFPADQNLNCIRTACFPVLEHWKGWVYSVSFALVMVVVSVGVSRLLHWIFPLRWENPKVKKRASAVFILFCVFAVLFTLWDTYYKSTLPSFSCGEPYEDNQAIISCRYTQEYDEGMLMMVYRTESKIDTPMLCRSYLNLSGDADLLHDDIYLEPREYLDIKVLLSYPVRDVVARLRAACLQAYGHSGKKTP